MAATGQLPFTYEDQDMKNKLFLLTCILASALCLPPLLLAQQSPTTSFRRDSVPDKAKYREQWFKSARDDEHGSMQAYVKARRQHQTETNLRTAQSLEFNAQWYPLGPSKTTTPVLAQLGLVSALWVDTTDFLTLYAGSNTGGLFKTTDGGENWHCLTDTVFTTGILSIHVDPRNKNRILAGTGHYSFSRNYGVGMLESLDGGLSWHETGLNTQKIPGNFVVQESGMRPDNPDHLLALINFEARFRGKIYKSTDGADSWQETYGEPGAELFCIAYNTDDPDVVYASGNRFLKSVNDGGSWEDLTHLITLDTNFRPTRIATSIAPAAPDSILVFCEAEDTTFTKANRKYLFLSTDNAQSFSRVQLRGDPFCSYWKMQLTWSPTRSDEFYLGGMWLYKYRIGGDSAHFIGNSLHTYHKDVRDLIVIPYLGNDRVYMGNDGGVTLSEDGTATYRDITRNGMQILQLYNITADDNSDNIFGGPQDGNISFYNTKTDEWWKHPRIGDAYDGMINYNNPDEVYLVSFPPNVNKPNIFLMKSTDGGANFSYLTIPDSTGTGRKDKPVAMDPVNPQVIYVGIQQVWKSENGGQTFERISNFSGNQKLVAIKVSPSNPQVILAAFENPYWSNPSQPKLMITPDGGNRWIDITPRGQLDLHFTGISDFAFHPDSSRKIWLALNRQWAGRQVFVTDNAGASWQNFSSGLPVLPVNAIRYVKGAGMDLLIAGTDVGVFYRDATLDAWMPFGTGLPLTIVSDLEINYKRKKIIAATFGRGLWETDLCLPVSETPLIVDENTIWDEDKNVLQDVIIAPGAALTLRSNIEMGRDRTIKVMPGASFTIDKGKLSANCIGLWKGIEVYGHPDFNDTTLPQGVLTLLNGAVIENARIALECIAINDTALPCTRGGGIIAANEAYFRNNIQSVLMHQANGTNPSTFKFCRFTNSELREGNIPEAMVELNGIQGIHFTSCQFENHIPTSTLSANKRGSGIKSFNSWFVVDKNIKNDSVPFGLSSDPLFKQLTYGIEARFSHPGYGLSIDGVRFDRNYTGAFISGAGFVNISNSRFKMLPSGPPDTLKPLSAGIYLDQCKLYNLSLNNFSGSISGFASNMPTSAMVINACGAANNMIAGNIINKTSFGLLAQNQNRSADGSRGMRLLNNWFNGNIYDVAITADSSAYNTGIASKQGTFNSEELAPAGNHFSYSKYRRDGDFRNHGPVVYYYHYLDSINHQTPTQFARISPIPVEGGYPGDSTYCPEWLAPDTNIEARLADWDKFDESIQQKKNNLTDGGNTPELLARIENHQGYDAPELYRILLDYSPYLSYSVLETLTGNNRFPNKMLMDVLLKNCHFIRLPDILNKLDQRSPEMPGWMQYALVSCYNQYSGLDHLQAEAEMTAAMRNGVYNLFSGSLIQSVKPLETTDYWQTALLRQNTAESGLIAAFFYLNQGDSISANSLLSNLESFDDFYASDKDEWFNLWKLNYRLHLPYPLCPGADSAWHYNFSDHPLISIVYLNNLSYHFGGVPYNEPYILPGKLPEESLPVLPDPSINSTFIELYPVPAQSHFIVNYQTEAELLAAGIYIIDLNGREVASIALNKAYDQLLIPVDHLKSGLYIVKIRLNAQTILYRKLVIAR